MSADLVIDDVVELAQAIATLVDDGIDGIVVTQGTDTLEETAYLLDLLLAVDVPVVVTGAMRNRGRPGEDGPANLVTAVRIAAAGEARAMGVLVALDDTVLLARHARKSHTSATGAFTAAGAGPVGHVVEDRVRIPLRPASRSPHLPVPAATAIASVALLTLPLGADDRMLREVPRMGYDGLVVATYGAGHVAKRLVPALADVASRVPVVFASRTGAGELYRQTGAYPGSETDLLRHGLISAVGLDPLKARLVLTLLLTAGGPHGAFAAVFEAASS
jgi:L-asparaginase